MHGNGLILVNGRPDENIWTTFRNYEIDVLLQERRNSIANVLELRLSCINPSRWHYLVRKRNHVPRINVTYSGGPEEIVDSCVVYGSNPVPMV